MLELTEDASQRLRKSLAAADRPDQQGKCFRIVPKNDKLLTLKLAKPAPSDILYSQDGDTILALPKALQPFFENKCLGIDDRGKLQLS